MKFFFAILAIATVAHADTLTTVQRAGEILRSKVQKLTLDLVLAKFEKAELDLQVTDLKQRGVDQQDRSDRAETDLHRLEKALSVEQEKHRATLSRYHQLKIIAASIAALFLGGLFLYGATQLFPLLTDFGAPWAVITGPLVGAGIGFALIWFLL